MVQELFFYSCSWMFFMFCYSYDKKDELLSILFFIRRLASTCMIQCLEKGICINTPIKIAIVSLFCILPAVLPFHSGTSQDT